jgi:hypothetical protein
MDQKVIEVLELYGYDSDDIGDPVEIQNDGQLLYELRCLASKYEMRMDEIAREMIA